jgi:hypothetical protein
MDWMFARSSMNRTSLSTPKFARVLHAFAKKLETVSRIQLSLKFLIIVIVCSSVKLLTMLWVVIVERRDNPVALGNGAASFLERSDPTTERICILSKPKSCAKSPKSLTNWIYRPAFQIRDTIFEKMGEAVHHVLECSQPR